MTTTLTKLGDDLALVIDKPTLESLGIDADTPLNVTTMGEQLIISREDPERRKRFDEAFARTIKEYGSMLKRLAE